MSPTNDRRADRLGFRNTRPVWVHGMGTDAFGGAWFLAREFVVLVFGHVDRLCSWTIDCGVNIRPVGEEMDISSTGVRCRDMWVALRNDIQDHADNYFRVSRHPHNPTVRVSILS